MVMIVLNLAYARFVYIKNNDHFNSSSFQNLSCRVLSSAWMLLKPYQVFFYFFFSFQRSPEPQDADDEEFGDFAQARNAEAKTKTDAQRYSRVFF